MDWKRGLSGKWFQELPVGEPEGKKAWTGVLVSGYCDRQLGLPICDTTGCRMHPSVTPHEGQRNWDTYPLVSICFAWKLFSRTFMPRLLHPPSSWAENIPAIRKLYRVWGFSTRSGQCLWNPERWGHTVKMLTVSAINTFVLRLYDVLTWIWFLLLMFTKYHLWRTPLALVLDRKPFPPASTQVPRVALSNRIVTWAVSASHRGNFYFSSSHCLKK